MSGVDVDANASKVPSVLIPSRDGIELHCMYRRRLGGSCRVRGHGMYQALSVGVRVWGGRCGMICIFFGLGFMIARYGI